MSLNKRDLIVTILYHGRVVKPHVNQLSQLKKDDLKLLAKREVLKVIGSRKDRIAQNIARHRVLGRLNTMKSIIEDVASKEVFEEPLNKGYKPKEVEGAFDENLVRFRSKGIEENRSLVIIKQYLQKTRHHALKKWEDLVSDSESWEVKLNVVVLFRKIDGSEECEKPIWSSLPHVIMEGSDFRK